MSSFHQNSTIASTNEYLDKQEILQAIYECVYGSTIRHVLKLPTDILVEYLAKFPFWPGADTLYYYLLKREGSNAHYAADGRHLVVIHPELIGIYILAEQDVKAPKMLHTSDETIYSMIKLSIDRTITCDFYKLRHSIIIGEAPFEDALKIPSIALNNPIYQHLFQQGINNLESTILLIEHDCWESIQTLCFEMLPFLFNRMSSSKGNFPNLWKLILKEYYSQQLLRFKIHDWFSELTVRKLMILNNLIPEIVQLPLDLDSIGLRLWYAPKGVRGYLLGFDISDGIPSDYMISERLHHLQNIGIEKYVEEITRVYVDEFGNLTGRIGMMYYPNIAGKKLINHKDIEGNYIGIYYPFDLLHIIIGNNVYIVPFNDIFLHVRNDTVINLDFLRNILTSENIHYLDETPDENQLKELLIKLFIPMKINRGVPARNKLVETMSYGILI